MPNTCPVCDEPAAETCRCPLADSRCRKGHSWHVCPVHGGRVDGPADHSGDTFRCRCPVLSVADQEAVARACRDAGTKRIVE